ncbi:MAG: DUF1801 domain-containing protein [Ferruginibacter sp.]|nr:DUF1801 domain-containing protein [Ferruginibacter sp.]
MSPLVDSYIGSLSDTQQAIAENVRRILFSLVPGIQEKLSFKIPFYHYFGMFCYINAIPNGIDVGLCRGKDLIDEFPSLELKGRAIVATVSLHSVKDIKHKGIREIIIAAALWNEEAKKKKIPMVKRRKL